MRLYDAEYLRQDGRDDIPAGCYWFKFFPAGSWGLAIVSAETEELTPYFNPISFACGDMHALYGPFDIPSPPEE